MLGMPDLPLLHLSSRVRYPQTLAHALVATEHACRKLARGCSNLLGEFKDFLSRICQPIAGGATSRMWTAPLVQERFDRFDRIACVHMSGLLVRSHMNAGQDGFRDECSKQHGDLVEGHREVRSVISPGSIDHTIFSFLASSRIRLLRQRHYAVCHNKLISMPGRLVAPLVPCKLPRLPSFSKQSGQSCWPARQPRAWVAYA